MSRVPHITVVAILLCLTACASPSKDFETPQGAMTGDQFGGFEILGVSHRATTSLNQGSATSGGSFGFSEDVTVNVPVGTQIVIPAVRGWRLAYGEIDPNSVEAHASLGDQNATWKTADHHLGVAAVNVFVKDVNAPNGNTQTATLTVSLLLSDDNGDDKWFGLVNYSLMFLGPKATAPTPPK
jgi:hypothetical protein